MSHQIVTLIAVLTLALPALADPVLLVDADDKIAQVQPPGYTVDDGGCLRTPAGSKARPECGLVAVEVEADTLADYRAKRSAQYAAVDDWEALIQEKIREMAIEALAAEGKHPPGEAKALKLKDGKVIESAQVREVIP